MIRYDSFIFVMALFYPTDGFHHKRDVQENMECEIYVTIAL